MQPHKIHVLHAQMENPQMMLNLNVCKNEEMASCMLMRNVMMAIQTVVMVAVKDEK